MTAASTSPHPISHLFLRPAAPASRKLAEVALPGGEQSYNFQLSLVRAVNAFRAESTSSPTPPKGGDRDADTRDQPEHDTGDDGRDRPCRARRGLGRDRDRVRQPRERSAL